MSNDPEIDESVLIPLRVNCLFGRVLIVGLVFGIDES